MSIISLSGPISSFICEYNGIKYIFFGDRHHNFDDVCPCEYDTVTLGENFALTYIHKNEKCMDILALLYNIFMNENNKQKRVEFYLENIYKIAYENFISIPKYNKKDIISLIYHTFAGCFRKIYNRPNDCIFKNVKFYTNDIRSTVNDNNIDSLTYSPDMYVSEKISEFTVKITENLKFTNEMIEYYHVLNFLINELYGTNSSNFVPKIIQLFSLCMNSDNFLNDVDNLFHDLKYSKYANNYIIKGFFNTFNNVSIKNINGKSMHIIGVEIDKLSKQNARYLKLAIISYFNNKSMNFLNKSSILEYWNIITKLYNLYPDKVTDSQIISLKTEIINKFFNVKDFLSQYSALYPDCYTIAKLLQYKPNTNKKVVYVGHLHLLNFYNFFSSLNVQKNLIFYGTQDEKGNGKRCIKININEYLN